MVLHCRVRVFIVCGLFVIVVGGDLLLFVVVCLKNVGVHFSCCLHMFNVRCCLLFFGVCRLLLLMFIVVFVSRGVVCRGLFVALLLVALCCVCSLMLVVVVRCCLVCVVFVACFLLLVVAICDVLFVHCCLMLVVCCSWCVVSCLVFGVVVGCRLLLLFGVGCWC